MAGTPPGPRVECTASVTCSESSVCESCCLVPVAVRVLRLYPSSRRQSSLFGQQMFTRGKKKKLIAPASHTCVFFSTLFFFYKLAAFELVAQGAEKRRRPICFLTYRFCRDASSSTFGSTSQFSGFDVVPNCSFQSTVQEVVSSVGPRGRSGRGGGGGGDLISSLLRTLFVCFVLFFLAVWLETTTIPPHPLGHQKLWCPTSNCNSESNLGRGGGVGG